MSVGVCESECITDTQRLREYKCGSPPPPAHNILADLPDISEAGGKGSKSYEAPQARAQSPTSGYKQPVHQARHPKESHEEWQCHPPGRAVRDSFDGEIRCRGENDEPAAMRSAKRPGPNTGARWRRTGFTTPIRRITRAALEGGTTPGRVFVHPV
jgi:hypothetical protein